MARRFEGDLSIGNACANSSQNDALQNETSSVSLSTGQAWKDACGKSLERPWDLGLDPKITK